MNEAGRGLTGVLSHHHEAERIRALRALLMRPLMGPADPDLPAVRRHAATLRTWLARETGWVLHVERDCARLYKRPADLVDATRGAPGFDRSRYVLLCLVAAVLERADSQITLRTLGERLLDLAADPELAARGFEFHLEQAHERRDLVHVCRYLLGLGVLQRVAGDEESYVQRAGDALYDVQRRLLAALFAGTRGPSTFLQDIAPSDIERRLAVLTEEFVPDSAEGRRSAERHRLARRLLDDPVTCFDELDDETREYLSNQRGTMAARLCEATDLVPEQRAEGVALIDPDGELSDAPLPAEGTVAHATLIVAQDLADRLRTDAGAETGIAEIEALLREAATRYARYWRKREREPGAERELAEQVLARLEALKLLRRTGATVCPRPALARFALGAPDLRQPRLID